jgi:hypothetical protein
MAIPIGHSLFGLAWVTYPIGFRQHWMAMISSCHCLGLMYPIQTGTTGQFNKWRWDHPYSIATDLRGGNI